MKFAIPAAYVWHIGPPLNLHPSQVNQDCLQMIKVSCWIIRRFQAWVYHQGMKPLKLNRVVIIISVFRDWIIYYLSKNSCETVDFRDLCALNSVYRSMHMVVSPCLVQLPCPRADRINATLRGRQSIYLQYVDTRLSCECIGEAN
jgi:hypothetical protein